ncbi:MAG: phospho-N-acetylmuramoyl-pentapeptide-transferase [Firmicutes bacterium]|nr:phospho-N-acetylmuramoyl-pentapeptide-transferase [Bacillota bacterium]
MSLELAIVYFLASFGVAAMAAPFIIGFLRRMRAGQEILKYVEMHKSKGGTPTMGGIIFILPVILFAPLFIRWGTPFALVALIGSVGYGLLGFLDDFIKVKTKNNMGLRAYQKIIGQGGIAILVAVFYTMVNPEGRILIPFFNVWWDIGFFIAPLVFFIMIATTNSVNLTDGLDGLAGMVTVVFLVFIVILSHFVDGIANIPESAELGQLSMIIIGGLCGFLLFNANRARVFMGDTGSLFLGGFVAMVSIFNFMGLFILVLGVMYVVSTASVIIQVLYFKKTGGKRVFLMTPFHHHLEHRGWAEARIVWLYTIITIIAGAGLVLSFV